MSAYNAGAILQGLNNGVVDAWKFGIQQDRIDRQEARQAEIDRRAAEAHDLNMRARQLEFDEVNRQVTERQGARQAATPQKAENGFAVGQQGSQNFYKDEATARAAAEDQAFIDGADAPQAPRQATALTGGGKPQIGAFGMKADNSRIGTAKRVADYWRSRGETDKADQIEMQAKETDRKLYDASREEIMRQAIDAVSRGGPGALVDLYDKFPDDRSAKLTQLPGGGGRFDQFDKNGNKTGSFEFKDNDDLIDKVYGMIFPDRLYEARAKSQAEIAKERAKGVKLSPGEQQYGYDASGRLIPLASNDNMSPTEKAALIRAGGSSGSGSTGKGGKASATPLSQASELWETVGTKGENKLPTDQFARGFRVVEELVGGGATPAVAVDAAMAVVTNPKATRLELNAESGTVDLVYENKEINGGKPLRVAAGAGTIAELEKTAGRDILRTEVAKMVTKKYGDKSQQMIQIASDPNLFREYLRQAEAKGLDVEEVKNRLNLIRAYLPPETKGGEPAAAKQSGRSLLDVLRGGQGPSKTDPSSRAGQFQEKQNRLSREKQQAEAAKVERARQVSEQFKLDKNSMDPLDFVGKYDPIRSQLSREDLIELRRIEELAFRRK